MDFSAVVRNDTSPLVGHKTMNYGDCILAHRAAAAAGMDERIFLNTRGQLAEGTVSNLFLVSGGRLYTPALSCGLLPGVLRDYLCRTSGLWRRRSSIPGSWGSFRSASSPTPSWASCPCADWGSTYSPAGRRRTACGQNIERDIKFL